MRYRPRHLKRRPVSRGPAVFGAATAVWIAGQQAAQAGTHTVRSGETLSGIAARYGTTVERLAAANNLANPNFIVAGTALRVPVAATLTSRHVIRSGETLSAIASRFGVSMRALARANHIADPNFIVAGTTLRVPGGASPPSATTAPTSAPVGTVEASLEGQAADHGVDVSLVKAVAWQESGWQQDVVSEAGAIGVMQVMPGTARYVNQVLGEGHRLNVRAADDNVHLGVMYLRHMLRAMPTRGKAIAAYFAGPGNVGRRLTKAQRHYVRAVRAHRPRFR